jgi:hypothetical protein
MAEPAATAWMTQDRKGKIMRKTGENVKKVPLIISGNYYSELGHPVNFPHG